MTSLFIQRRGSQAVETAREWIGTPFRHQQALKGVGTDCGGLVRGVGAESGLMAFDEAEWRRRFAGYARTPNPNRMRAVLTHYLLPIEGDDAVPGDIMWMGWRENLPMHLAFLAEFDGRRMMIHAYSGAGQVVEHGLSPDWEARIEAWYRLPGVQRARAKTPEQAGAA